MAIREERQREVDRDQGGETAPVETEAADLRDPQLDEDVACCLAEIDEVLAEAKSEKDIAREEFDAITEQYVNTDISPATRDDKLRVWSAKYAHLGLAVGQSCCGEPYMYER